MGKHKKDKKSKKKHKKRERQSESDSASNSSWEEIISSKRKKKNRDDTSSSSSSESGDDADSKPKRDDWMADNDMDMLLGSSSGNYRQEKAERLAEKKRNERKVDIEVAGQHANELNPYWKKGGDGLPSATTEKSRTLVATHSGSGQLDWLLRAHKRLKEEAADKNISVEEAARERWGSLAKLEGMIAEAQEKSRGGRSKNDLGYENRGSRMTKPQFENDDSSYNRRRFSKPREDRDDDHRRQDSRKRSSDHRESSWRKSSHRRSPERRREQGARSPKEDRRKDDRDGKNECVEPRKPPSVERPLEEVIEKPMEEKEAPKVLSDTEMNKLASKLLKAEMMGNGDLVAKLKKKVADARKLREENPDAVRENTTEVVVLTKTDSRGIARPVQPLDEQPSSSRKRKPKAQTHDQGERQRYFADDDRQSLHQMFEREKLSTAADDNAMFAKMAGKMRVKAGDEDYTVDDAFVEKAARHDDSSAQKARDINKAMQEHREMKKTLDSCQYCCESPACPKHLLISIGEHSSLCLPAFQSLVDGHCLIVPNQHFSALTMVDENVWAEIQRFRREVTRMFGANDMDCVFLETVTRLHKQPHTVLQCIPVPQEVGEMIPMYFKKAILESETEWAMNKKLVDLSKKNLRNSIPKGLPYFAVDFGTQDGFAHVIEDEQEFPNHFGLEVVGGLMDCEPRLWLKQQRESFQDQSRKAIEFSKMWSDYDFNQKIN